jgi:hypothetical protein
VRHNPLSRLVTDYGCSPDVGDRNDNYNLRGLYMLVTYEKGQDNLFCRHDEERARASKCSRRLIEIKRDPTVKCVSQLPKERRGQEMVLRQETQLATPEQQGSAIYPTTGHYSQPTKTIDEL